MKLSDDIRIDSHKLIFHPDRVASWFSGENIYPLTVEISPSGSCNHRCCFCAFDYLDYQPAFLDQKLIVDNLRQMADKGVKSIVVAGEGEPLLNKATPEIINTIKEIGMDVGMSSNGVFFTPTIAEECLSSLTWVRFSVNAGTSETYYRIHGGKQEDFKTVLANIENAVKLKQERKLATTIGVQMLMISDNVNEVVELGKKLSKIGVDYFTVKPYSQHPRSLNAIDTSFDYQAFLGIEEQLNKLKTESFQVMFRSNSMQKLSQCRSYHRCLGLPYWAYIDSKANVWACIAYVGDDKFRYGNLREKSFTAIWEGLQREKVMNHVANMDVSECRELCRLDEINHYLHQLKYPSRHANFI
jgi:MoaA/NifB/PqqE/SkfB family radical SAM enzyme